MIGREEELVRFDSLPLVDVVAAAVVSIVVVPSRLVGYIIVEVVTVVDVVL